MEALAHHRAGAEDVRFAGHTAPRTGAVLKASTLRGRLWGEVFLNNVILRRSRLIKPARPKKLKPTSSSGNRIVYPLFEVSQKNSQGSLSFRRGSHVNRQEEYTVLPPKERLPVAGDAPDMPCSPRSNCCHVPCKLHYVSPFQTTRAPVYFVGAPI